MTQCQYFGCVITVRDSWCLLYFLQGELTYPAQTRTLLKSLNIPNSYESGRRPPATNTLSWIGEYPFTTEK